MQPHPRFGGFFAEWPQRDIARPESSANGLAIKAVMLIHMEGRERRVLVAAVIDTPMELPPIRAELRERAEALTAEYDAP